MQLIQNSLDVLYISLAGAVILLTLFLCWTLYYAVLSLKDVRSITRDIKIRFEKIWNIVDLLKDKLQVGGAAFKIAATAVKELSDFAKQWIDVPDKKKKK